MNDSLQGHVLVLSGANGRLGKYLATAYHRAGAHVVGLTGTVPKEPAAFFDTYTQVDILHEESVRTAFKNIKQAYGRIDTFIHAAGAWDGRPFAETTLSQWKDQIDINLTSAFLCFREAVANMDEGMLIAIASRQGADRGVGGQAGYSASKGGLIRLIESISEEYMASGISACTLAPSTILYHDSSGSGVSAHNLADTCLFLSTPAGHALNGTIIRAFGPAG